jgi:hypothetical protein
MSKVVYCLRCFVVLESCAVCAIAIGHGPIGVVAVDKRRAWANGATANHQSSDDYGLTQIPGTTRSVPRVAALHGAIDPY